MEEEKTPNYDISDNGLVYLSLGRPLDSFSKAQIDPEAKVRNETTDYIEIQGEIEEIYTELKQLVTVPEKRSLLINILNNDRMGNHEDRFWLSYNKLNIPEFSWAVSLIIRTGGESATDSMLESLLDIIGQNKELENLELDFRVNEENYFNYEAKGFMDLNKDGTHQR